MSAQITKRARIAKIRGIEKRVAELGLARADRELRHIEGIAGRLKALKSDLDTADCATTGASLAARTELKMRLATAARATIKPLNDAANRRSEQRAAATVAHRKADGAQTLLDRVSVEAVKAIDHRADANRIAGRNPMLEGDVS